MEKFEFRKDENGLWNKNIKPEDMSDLKVDIEKRSRKIESRNDLDFKEKGEDFQKIEKKDEEEFETITELRLMIDMMKKDPATDPLVLQKIEEELAEEIQKREELEPQVLEKEDEASFALQKKKNLLN